MGALSELVAEVRNGVLGAKGALRLCRKRDCPLGLGAVQVDMEIKHHLSRIDRALRVYVAQQKREKGGD